MFRILAFISYYLVCFCAATAETGLSVGPTLPTIKKESSNTNFREFIHLTDAHLDDRYHVGAPRTCVLGSTGLGCCRKDDIPNGLHVLGSRPWGEFTCDAPIQLMAGVVSWIGQYVSQNPVDVVLYGGDTVGHHDFTQSTSSNIALLQTMSGLFRAALPNTTVLMNQGNHDTYPIDQTPPWNRETISRVLRDAWTTTLVEGNTSSLSQGYYSWKSSTSPLRVVSLNSLVYDSHNYFHWKDVIQAQQTWFQNYLKNLQQAGEYAFLLGHIPPGGGESTQEYNQWMLNTLEKYSTVVKLSVFGHSHLDQLYLYPKTMAPPALVSPSIMPDARDPCFRIYRFETSTGVVVSYRQMCVDLEATNDANRLVVYLHYDSSLFFHNLTRSGILDWYRRAETEPELKVQYCLNYYGRRNGQEHEPCRHNISVAEQVWREIPFDTSLNLST